MTFLKLKIAFCCIVTTLTCDIEEKEAAPISDSYYQESFFIQSVEGIFDQNVDLENLFRILEFKNENHTLPFILSDDRVSGRIRINSYENPRNLSWVTISFTARPGLKASLVLYGCSIFKKKIGRIILFDERIDKLDELKAIIPAKIPEKRKIELNKCQKEANLYIVKCLSENFSNFEKIQFLGFLFIGMSILVLWKCTCFRG